MAVTEEMARIALRVRPDQVTLVPERPQELTTEGGLDVVHHAEAVAAFVRRMQDAGIAVSLFIDPDEAQVAASKRSAARAIEINTGAYADAPTSSAPHELDRITTSARAGAAAGLEVLAGHGLDYVNVQP